MFNFSTVIIEILYTVLWGDLITKLLKKKKNLRIFIINFEMLRNLNKCPSLNYRLNLLPNEQFLIMFLFGASLHVKKNLKYWKPIMYQEPSWWAGLPPSASQQVSKTVRSTAFRNNNKKKITLITLINAFCTLIYKLMLYKTPFSQTWTFKFLNGVYKITGQSWFAINSVYKNHTKPWFTFKWTTLNDNQVIFAEK